MVGFKKAQDAILAASSIVIASHVNPDGDSIGSLLSLGLGLQQLGKEVYMLSPDGTPNRYRRLPGAHLIKTAVGRRVDLAIAVDCGDKNLLGAAFATFERAKAVLEIDHHEFRRPFGDIRVVDYNAAAVGELVYRLLKELKIKITKDIAQNILTSIVVETNSFRLPNVRVSTFRICSEVLETGVDFSRLTEMVFWNRTREAALLSGICLSRCKFISSGRIAWSIARAEDLKKVKGKQEDLDAVADEIRSIKKVRLAILLREKGKWLRVALRSKGKINVARLAENYGGGGHFDAAGCLIPNTQEAINVFLSRARSLLT